MRTAEGQWPETDRVDEIGWWYHALHVVATDETTDWTYVDGWGPVHSSNCCIRTNVLGWTQDSTSVYVFDDGWAGPCESLVVGPLHRIDVKTGSHETVVAEGSQTAPELSPQGSDVATTLGSTVSVTNLATGITRSAELPDPGGYAFSTSSRWAPDGAALVFHVAHQHCGEPTQLVRYDLATGEVRTLLSVPDSGALAVLEWSTDGTLLVSVTDDAHDQERHPTHQIRIDARSGQELPVSAPNATP